MTDFIPKTTPALSLEGEVAVVTGGGTGLGRAVAGTLSACGARVAITGRTESTLESAVRQMGDGARYYVHDLSVQDTAPQVFERIASDIGSPTILVNNAGVHLKKPVADTRTEEFQALLSTHVLGAFNMSSAAIPHMKQARRGNIVFMTSMTALIGMTKVIAYAAAKSAYLGMVRTLASELAPDGIRVNAIAPGWIETPMLHGALDNDPERKNRILSRTPMARFGEPEDIGWAVAFLCSPLAKFITGVVLPVDGGASIGF
jgi:gluconate 5-dehydrogenase